MKLIVDNTNKVELGAVKKPLMGHTKPRVMSIPHEGKTLGPDFGEFAKKCGIELLPWQQFVADDFLSIDESGLFKVKTGVLLITRRQGKTFFAAMRILYGLFVLGEKNVLAMSSNRAMALTTFREVCNIIEENEFLRCQVKLNIGKVGRFGSGQERIELKNGAIYEIVAATRDGSRGKNACLLFIDECREISPEAMAAAKPTTRSEMNAQTIIVSNAGDAFSQVLNDLKDRAMSYPAPTLGWYEYSAPAYMKIDDRKGWQMSNPALGYRVSEAALEEALSTDTVDQFRTETLCQWISSLSSPWPLGAFEDLADTTLHMAPGPYTIFGFDVSQSRRNASLVAGQLLPDGRMGVGILQQWSSQVAVDDLRIAADIKGWCDKYLPKLVCFDHYATQTIANRLSIAGVMVFDVSGQQFYEASMNLLDAIVAKRIVHSGQPSLSEQMNAVAAKTNEGSWRIIRRQSAGDVSAPISLAMVIHKLQEPASMPMIFAG